MTTGTGLKEFLSRALPWPGDDDPGFINIHWKSRGQDGRDFWMGKPTRTVEQFLSQLHNAKTWKGVTDIYHCMSRQARSGVSKKGTVKAERQAKDALLLKAIWLDIDVKPPPKGYATQDDALRAIGKFIGDAALPPPSALISSGGGIHAYWIVTEPVTPAVWQPYANGLKALAIQHGLLCDTQCTVDSARILRVPDTLNYKTDPPTPVFVLIMGHDYDIAQLAVLPTVVPATPTAPGAATTAATTFDLSAFDTKPAWLDRLTPAERSALAGPLHVRGGPDEFPPLDPHAVFQGCAFFREALLTGGKDHAQPEWNLAVLGTVFMENGHDLAHKIGKAHPSYTQESTDTIFARKEREHTERGIGWPSCGAIEDAGCTACRACPHYGKIKSPLNLALAPKAKANLPAVPQTINTVAGPVTLEPCSLLPDRYELDDEGVICRVVMEEQEKGQPPTKLLCPLFLCKLYNPWPQKDRTGGDMINFLVSVDGDHMHAASVRMTEFGAYTICSALTKQRVKYHPGNKRFLEEFWMHWLGKLHAAAEAMQVCPFGWHVNEDTGDVVGFVYGGELNKLDGTRVQAGYIDPLTRRKFTPRGTEEAWYAALKLVFDQQRPELDILVAVSFASILMHFCGDRYNAILSAYGQGGCGKSTACMVGAAVWGHPKTTRLSVASTLNMVGGHMGTVRSLPTYWDDATVDLRALASFIMSSTQGLEKGRMNQDASIKEQREWQLMTAICTNESLITETAKALKTTDAALFRIFEFWVEKIPDVAGRVEQADASAVLGALESNYGVIGLRYVRHIIPQYDRVRKMVHDFETHFAHKIDFQQEERFWTGAAGCILAGATLAKEIGVPFDVNRLYHFMENTVYELRKTIRSAAVSGASEDNTNEILGAFLNHFRPSTIWTDTVQFLRPGQRPKVTTVRYSSQDRGRCDVQWGVDDRVLKFSMRTCTDYLSAREISSDPFRRGLIKHYGATFNRSGLALGTQYAVSSIECATIQIPPGSPLEVMLHSFGPGAGATGCTGPAPPPPTGIAA